MIYDTVSHRIVAHAYRGRARAWAGDLAGATEDARVGAAVWRDSGSRGTGLMHGSDLAEALVRAGLEEEAEECLKRHREVVRATGSRMRRGVNALFTSRRKRVWRGGSS